MIRRLKPQTLQTKLVLFVLLPVAVLVFLWGLAGFIVTRNALLRQWNETAVLKLQRGAHFMEMRLLRPVELVETIYRSVPPERAPFVHRFLVKALRDIDGVADVRFTYTGHRRVLPMKEAGGMRWRDMPGYDHARVMAVTSPTYDALDGRQKFRMSLDLLDGQKATVARIDIIMRFDYVIKDLHLQRQEWLKTGMACIVDQDLNYLFHTDMEMDGRRRLADTDDALEARVKEKMQSARHGTVTGRGHPPDRVAGFYKMDNVPWTIIIYGRGETILKPIIRFRNGVAVSGMVLIFGVVFLIRLHVVGLARRIRTLAYKAVEVARGEYGSPLACRTVDELGTLVDSFNAMVEGLKERDYIRDSFGSYVDPDVAREILSRPGAAGLGGLRKSVVIMMTDIRGFTRMAERLTPESTIELLNGYFSHMIDIVQSHQGIIVDFFGDGILIFFEPRSERLHPALENALNCAAVMQAAMQTINRETPDEVGQEIAMGIGIHTGPVIVGNMGSESRKKYGIVGAAVNLTSRVQATAGAGEIVVTRAVHDRLRHHLAVVRKFDARLKGIDDPVDLYAVRPASSL